MHKVPIVEDSFSSDPDRIRDILHSLNNRLTVISGLSGILLRENPDSRVAQLLAEEVPRLEADILELSGMT